MACAISCMVSVAFIIGMIYFYYFTHKNKVVSHYKTILSPEAQRRFDKIVKERTTISTNGYILGVLISILVLYYKIKVQRLRLSSWMMVCTAVAITFLTNYFYYVLYPKSDWMLNHVETKQETMAWLAMYREMQYNYHMGLALGVVAVGLGAFAFRY